MDATGEARRQQRDQAVIALARMRLWQHSEECHDEIARVVSRPGHQIDARLSPRQQAHVRAGAAAAVQEPRQVLRFGLLEAALARVSAESPDAGA